MEMNLHYVTDNQFTAYSDTSVTIKEVEYTDNVIVTNNLVQKLAINCIKELAIDNLSALVAFKPDLIIFGTGGKHEYPNQEILSYLQKTAIGVEVMTIKALCRTYNFLISEGRKVGCVILFEVS